MHGPRGSPPWHVGHRLAAVSQSVNLDLRGALAELGGPVLRVLIGVGCAVAITSLVSCSAGMDPAAPQRADAIDTESAGGEATPGVHPVRSELRLLDDEPTGFLKAVASTWETDFEIHTVPYAEIKAGGPPRDGIPPIDRPVFAAASEAPDYLVDEEPVLVVELGDEQRAYPLSILILHEIVNDVVGGEPVAVTYCPLCNTGLVFKRTVNGQVLRFGTTGLLRNSNLIMWDDATESWWQQATAEAIVGEFTGQFLELIPVQIVSWDAFRDTFEGGVVLTRDTGFVRSYDLPPYGGYDASLDIITEFSDGSLSPIERVVSIVIGDKSVAYPFTALEEIPIVHDRFEGRDLVIFYVGGTLSPFPKRPIFDIGLIGSVVAGGDSVEIDPSTVERRSVGATAVFEPFVDGERLTFIDRDGVITDRETSSAWNIFGEAVSGDLAGSRLTPILHGNHFWFAQQSFFPDTLLRTREVLAGY